MIRFDVFGRPIGVERKGEQWVAYELGGEGKRCLAPGIVIPAFVEEAELQQYLADFCHEWATPDHREVRPVAE
jgi:hypothetical protein